MAKPFWILTFFAIALLQTGFDSKAAPAPPANFSVEDVVTGLDQPMAIRFFPDGRMLILQKKGIIRIVNLTSPVQSAIYMNLADPAHSAGLESDQERGVQDAAIDPNFPTSPYIYIYYTAATGPNGPRGRIARFTHIANSGGITSRGDLNSELILWQDTDGYDASYHFGGGLSFGPDGNLWLPLGDHFQGSYASNLQKAGGKIHRITKTGGIPGGNPYNDGIGPNVDSIFAYGLRNPFRSRWDLTSGRLFIAEVGGNDQLTAWEDLHVLRYVQASGRFVDNDYGTVSDNGVYDGINYGYPTVEGMPPHTDFPGAIIDAVGEPIFSYKHNNDNAAVIGGLVYRGTQFPSEYQGAYFYADFTRGFIRYLKFNADGSVAPNPNPGAINFFNPDSVSYSFDLSPVGKIVYMEVGPDGALYYVSFTDSSSVESNPGTPGSVRRYIYTAGNTAPVISQYSATPSSGLKPLTVSFQFRASDLENDALRYVLSFGDGTTTGAPQTLTANTLVTVPHTYSSDGLYQARLDILDNLHTTSSTLQITVGTPPVINSLTSSNSRSGSTPNMFRFGDTITFSGTASDAQDGTLGGANFSWSIVLVHDDHTHPVLGPITGVTSINFPISAAEAFTEGEFYRCFLTVTDSSGISTTSSRDILPEKSNISFNSVPPGIAVQIDGNTATPTPFVAQMLINYNAVVTVPASQCVGGTQYQFSQWSNGPLTPQRTYNVPATDASVTANYTAVGTCAVPSVPGLVLRLESDVGVTQSGNIVSQWRDQSGFGNDLAGSGNPQFGTVQTPSGQFAITLNGTSGKLERTGTLSAFPNANSDRTMFLVARYNSSSAWAGLAYGTGANNQAFGLNVKSPTGELGLQGWGGGNDLISTTPGIGAGWLLQEGLLSGGTATLYKDSVQIAQFTHTFNTVLSKLVIGQEIASLGYAGMDVAAVFLYNRALSASERASIENYLQSKYLQGVPPPPNDPPTVTITAPANGSSFSSGSSITFTGTANDPEQGNLSASIQWSSSLDGSLGSGASISRTLSAGTHTISASVTDNGNLIGSANITVTVGTSSPPGGLITAGLVLQLESDLNVATQGGTTVTGWMDQSGLGNNLVAGGSPQLAAVLTPSGRPAITLNGTSGKLERTGTLSGFPSGNGDRTMFLVTKYNSSSAWGGAAYGTGANNQTFGLNIKSPSGELGLQGWGGGNDLISTTAGIGAGWLIQEGLLSTGTATLFKDGTQIGQFVHTFNTVLTKLVIGQEIASLGYIGMDVAAVLVYNRALNSTERASVEGYLRTKFFGSAPANTPPIVSITSPANGSSVASGSAITFSGAANDAEQGNLSASIQWSSSRDGVLGTGSSIIRNTLSVGTHAIIASVTDSGGLTGSTTNTINVTAQANTPPVVNITAPANNASFASGASITFTGTANDAEQGNLNSSIQWSSSLDGSLGSGASISRVLSVGSHTITASATDSGNLVGSANISVTVNAPSGGLITSGLVLRLESDAGVTTSGATVTGWLDQSGSGNNVTSSGSPQLGAILTPSGLSAITLNGTSGKLERTASLNGLPSGNADRTLFFVVKYNTSSAWAGLAYGTGADNQAFGLNIKHPTGELGLQGWGGGNDLVSITPGLGAGWLLQEGVLSGGTSTLYKNGTQIGQFVHTYNTVLAKLVIGQEIASLGYVGIDVAAVLVYNRALSSTERASVEAYLQNKFLQSGPPPNTPPTVTITTPANNSSFVAGASITFIGTANDAEQGNLNASIQWSSDLDGTLGTGASVTTSTLRVGTHKIRAAVTDSGGLTGSTTNTLSITAPGNTPPVVNITAPANNASFVSGTSITFNGTANDTQQGNLSASIQWSSDLDGTLGTGASVTTSTLRVGTHKIRAAVTDSGGLTGSTTNTLSITAPGNTPPVVNITAPANNASFVSGTSITFTGTANDTQQGNLSASIQWSSDLDGTLGTGASVTNSTLRVGTHKIRAAVTDSGGLTGSTTNTLSITAPANTPPVVNITAPPNNASFAAGTSITFTGTANDTEQGNLSASIQWSSDLDGALGTSASITTNTLRVGTHKIRAAVTDNGGLTGSATNTVTITPTNTAPVVTITAPANNATFASSASITFTGTANDTQQGNLSSSIQWTSSRDGSLGTGATVSRTLSAGLHTVTASVTDNGSLTGTASVTVKITSPTGLLTSGLVLLLESDLSVTSTNGVVSAWVDLSGLGNDLTPGGSPRIGSVQTPSTKPSVSFDGVAAKLERAQSLNSIPSGNAERTMFFVVKYNSTSVAAGAATGNSGNNRAFALVANPPSGVLAIDGGGGRGNDLASSTAGVGAGWLVQAGLLSGGRATLFKNGTSIASFNHSYSTANSRVVLAQDVGNTGFAAIDVAAFLIYNRALTTTEIANVENYLETKYLQAPAGLLSSASISKPMGPDALNLLGLEVRNGMIILRYPTLQPIGNYHLHAITNVATQDLADPANRIESWDILEIELMEPWERSGIYYEYPLSDRSAFFRLFIDPAQ